MRFNRPYLLATSVLAGALLSNGTIAQEAAGTLVDQAPKESATTEIDEIVVTGTRLRRDPANSPTPLISVSSQDLLETGQNSVIDYLSTIPALSSSQVPSDTTGSLGIGGLSLANLRALGASRTLTLIDGRRQVGSQGGRLSVDADTIPRLLIQNVEIVTGGASSVYGADAVSGVLNFITKKDFDGLEIDTQYNQINDDGQGSTRISGLVGKNFFDDRLNLYASAEYEKIDEVRNGDIDWVKRGPKYVGIDADPAANRYDGRLDNQVFYGLNSLNRVPWGVTTLANVQPPSDLGNPNVAYYNCLNGTSLERQSTCVGVSPQHTYVYDGTSARLANFGQRVGNVGVNRPYNIGGDGVPTYEFERGSVIPESESQRYQIGANFKLTENILFSASAKFIDETTKFSGTNTFYDTWLNNDVSATDTNPIASTSEFDLRWEDNAFLPQNLKDALATNMVTPYSEPTSTSPGIAGTPILIPVGRHVFYGPARTQSNSRELQSYTANLSGQHGGKGFVKSWSWDLGYVYGKAESENIEVGTDSQRLALAADAVFDTAGLLGTPGGIVCRSSLLNAQGRPVTDRHRLQDPNIEDVYKDLNDTEYGRQSLAECTPLNIFGAGNQSAEALDYVGASVVYKDTNEQHQAIGSISSELWDLWGAGNLGFVIGGEWRKETSSTVGRDATGQGRLLLLNTGSDMPEVGYESREIFTEVSLPLLSDSRFGDYAELSGSYRWADYSTVGDVDVYGVNLIYRPVPDLTFKTSFNTSVRVPNLNENFSPYSQTFANSFADPCTTANITAQNEEDVRQNRIANCTALAQEMGLEFDFAGDTPENTDDFRPNYKSVRGVLSGNPNLTPEESESFTFTIGYQPSFLPNFSLVLDYYEIRIDDVISGITAARAAANCVDGDTLNTEACATIFRNSPDIPFGVGAPVGDEIGGFIQQSFNYAALETRGLDFNARYSVDTADWGKNWGRFSYGLRGSWLIAQKQFLNEADPTDYTENVATVGLPHVRMTSQLSWMPNEDLSLTWSADWQSSQNIIRKRDFINNADSRLADQLDTGNFTRHDISVRYDVNDELSVRGGVTNLFDAEQRDVLETEIESNFDPYGRRFFVGLSYKPW